MTGETDDVAAFLARLPKDRLAKHAWLRDLTEDDLVMLSAFSFAELASRFGMTGAEMLRRWCKLREER